MADPGNTYNNSPGFTDTGNGVVADPTTVGSETDYKSWDWKQIMAAITGSAATTDSAQGAGVADPASLSQAAQQLLHVQRTLEMIGKNLGEQRDALTKNGAWKGEAADSFSTAIDSFMADVRSQAEALAGSSKGWGSISVPNQLQKNSVELSTAQQRIHEIDAWYAHQAQLAGVQPMSNGLIPVSQKPEIVTMLNAMSQGNDGSLSTIHANSSLEVFNRIGTYAIQSRERLPLEATTLLISGALDFVVFLRKHNEYEHGGGQARVVESIREIVGHDGQVLSSEVFAPGPDGRAAAHAPIACIDELRPRGYDPEVHGGWA